MARILVSPRLPPHHTICCGRVQRIFTAPVNGMAFDPIENTAKQLVLTVQEYSLFAYRALFNLNEFLYRE